LDSTRPTAPGSVFNDDLALAYKLLQSVSPAVTTTRRRVLIADEHFTTGNLKLAESLCKELWEAERHTPMLTAMLGEIFLLRNRPSEAEPLLRKALNDQGGNPRLLGSLAECLRRSDRLAEAAALYQKLGRFAFSDKLRRLADGGWYLTSGTPFYLAGEQYPLVDARINDQVDTLLFLDTGMMGAAVGLPFSTAEEAGVEVARDIEGAGFGISSAMWARPFIGRSLTVAGAERMGLPGMLIGNFRLEHQAH
jgi:hypothetical protein